MSSFDEREKGFERKFQQDQEVAFKVKARRNRLFGEWAAAKLGLAGAEADKYAHRLVEADVHKSDADIIAQIAADLGSKGVDAAQVARELDRAALEAKKQLGVPN